MKVVDSFDGKNNSYIKYISTGDEYENLSPKEYLDMIRAYLRDMINDHKTPVKLPDKVIDSENKFDEWKIHLKMQINCISPKNFKETRIIYSPSNNVEIFMGVETFDIIDELLKSLLERFQKARETSNNRGSEFIHENVGLLHYIFQQIA